MSSRFHVLITFCDLSWDLEVLSVISVTYLI
jgi:hypothetical protein